LSKKIYYFDKYERITLDILRKRETFYKAKFDALDKKAPADFSTLQLPEEELRDLNKSIWLFNAKLVEIYPAPETKKTSTLSDGKNSYAKGFSNCACIQQSSILENQSKLGDTMGRRRELHSPRF